MVQKLHFHLTYITTKIGSLPMDKKKFTTTLDETLIKAIKKLAIDLGLSANDLIEEGMHSVLKKYRRQASRK
jgi:hypothetical protein